MRAVRKPFKLFVTIASTAPVLFGIGMVLFFTERSLGEGYRVQESGMVGLAANLSLIGVTAIVRLLVNFGPHLLILLGIALPVVGALYVVEQFDFKRARFSNKRRSMMWAIACSESLLLLGLFVVAFEMFKA